MVEYYMVPIVMMVLDKVLHYNPVRVDYIDVYVFVDHYYNQMYNYSILTMETKYHQLEKDFF